MEIESGKITDQGSETEEILILTPLNMLREGILLPHDIYDINKETVLLYKDEMLDSNRLSKLKSYCLSADEDSVNISVQTYRLMMEKYLSCKISDPIALEAASEYPDMLIGIMSMISQVKLNKAIFHDTVGELSEIIMKGLENMSPGDILDLVNIPAPAETYFLRHTINVAFLSGLIGKWMGLSAGDVNFLSLVGLLHDCGKIALPDSIIMAPRPLTYVEFEIVKMHSVYGYELLSDYSDGVKYGVRDHHENLDAEGYPDGISGGSISLAARVVSIADVYTAIVADRPWRAALSPFHALSHLEAFAGIKFDAEIAEVFRDNVLKELKGKPVQLSDGTVGVVAEIDLKGLEYPYIRMAGPGSEIIKSHRELFCEGIYFGPMI